MHEDVNGDVVVGCIGYCYFAVVNSVGKEAVLGAEGPFAEFVNVVIGLIGEFVGDEDVWVGLEFCNLGRFEEDHEV